MKTKLMSLAAVAGILAGCADSPLRPVARKVPTMNAAVFQAAASRHVVEFNGPVRKDFAAQVAALGGSVDYVVESLGFAGVSGLGDAAAASLGRKGGVGSVYADLDVRLDMQPTRSGVAAADVEAASIANPAAAFRFSYQWNMRAIGANTAWAAGFLGSPNVTAAILDTGIDYTSFDATGMVDLARSVSLVPSDNAIIAALFPGRNAIDDLNGHGTNVATQVSSNGTIFAGVNSRARLMSVKVLGYNGGGSLGGILAGLIWAADNGADVANMSLGAPTGTDKAGSDGLVGLTNRVFNYAHQKRMVVVVSAGNEATDMDASIGRILYQNCDAPHVICVAATGPTASANPFFGPWANVDAPASYSNFGQKSITVAAPGGTGNGVISSVCPRHYAAVSGNTVSFPCDLPPGFFITFGFAGTSQAAPHVTGVVAQLIARYGKQTPSRIKQLLLQGVDDLGPAGADPFYGAGRVNVAKALGL